MLGLDFVNLPSLLILSVSQLPGRERCLLPDRECCPARIPPPASVQETLTIAHLCADGRESIGETSGFVPPNCLELPPSQVKSFLSRPKEMAAPKGGHYDSNKVQLPAEDCHLVDVCGDRTT
jgi:hypothetical protein